MDVGIFIPIGNNGWMMSENAPQYMPSFDLNKTVAERAEAAGYDFLLLRAEAGENVREDADWWTRFQEADDGERAKLLEQGKASGPSGGNKAEGGKKRRRRRRRRPRRPQAQPA